MEENWLEQFILNRPLLYSVVGRFVRPDEIEDIVQETFLHSYAASRQQTIRNPQAFMVKTARNIALNHLNRAENRLNRSLEGISEEHLDAVTRTLEDEYQSREVFMVFCRAVAALPSGCRRVFILKKVYGLSQKEIAEHLGIAGSTVEKHVAKGILLISEFMAETDCSPAEAQSTENGAGLRGRRASGSHSSQMGDATGGRHD